jgi:hypothetical protein
MHYPLNSPSAQRIMPHLQRGKLFAPVNYLSTKLQLLDISKTKTKIICTCELFIYQITATGHIQDMQVIRNKFYGLCLCITDTFQCSRNKYIYFNCIYMIFG